MQLALQTLIYRTTELNTVQASDNTAAMSAELSGFRFSDLMHVMHAPAPELSPESTGERKLPLVGMRLPSAGNTLPATGDLLAAANPKGVLSAKINEILNESDRSLLSARPAGEALNETGRSLPLARPDSEADGPYARSLVAEVVRNMNTFGDPEPVPQGPGKVAGTASMFTGQPEPAVSPAESKLFDQIRNPAEVSERPQTLSHNSVYPSPALPRAVRDGAPGHRGNPRVVLPPAGLRESALSGPRPASAPESHVPAGAIIDQLSQPQSPRKGTPAPFIQEAEFGRLTDNQPGNRDDAARSAIAKMHDYRADAANRN